MHLSSEWVWIGQPFTLVSNGPKNLAPETLQTFAGSAAGVVLHLVVAAARVLHGDRESLCQENQAEGRHGNVRTSLIRIPYRVWATSSLLLFTS